MSQLKTTTTMGELRVAELAGLDTEKTQMHDSPDEERIRIDMDDSKYQNL